MKKVIALFVALSIVLSLSLPAMGAQISSAEKGNFPKILADLSDMNAITKTGLKSSTEYSKSGAFTAVLEGTSLSKSTVIPSLETDLTGAEYVEFNVYCPEPTSTAFALALVSDNPATASIDYYYALAACNYRGWKLFSFRLQSLRTTGTPKGLDSIEKLMIIPGHGGSKVDPNAKIFLDNIVITDVESEGANQEETKEVELEPLVLWEPVEGGKNVGEFEGKLAYQWGPGEDEIMNHGIPDITPKEGIGMEKYKDLVIEMYAVKANNHPFLFRLYGPDNPETSGADFYYGGFSANWAGEWKEIRIAITGGMSDFGDFKHSDKYKPLFKPCEATKIALSPRPYSSSQFFPDTIVYVSKVYLDGARQEKTVENPMGEIILPDRFDSKTMTDYVSLVKEKHPDKHHPRLIVTDELLNRIKKYKDTDPFMKSAYDAVKKAADEYLKTSCEPPYHRDSLGTGYRFIRTVEEIAKNCGIMYLITGDTKYANRIWTEVENMINADIPWYKTNTGLDCGHISNGMALAYDWLYDYLSKDQKRQIRNALMTHAYDYAIKIRGGGGYLTFKNNVVAANSKGFVTAALAICDEPGYEGFCNEFINLVVQQLPSYLLYQYVPDGNYSEGLGYWGYSISSLLYMTNAMKTAAGTDGGLEDHPGLKDTCYLPFAMRGTTTTFNYADAGADALQEGHPVYFYLASRYNVPQLASYRLETYKKYGGANADDIIWYNPEEAVSVDWRTNLPKDYILDGLEPSAIMRTGYDPDSVYLGTKGGNPKTGHDHYDAGTFVLDAFGTRWFVETGAEEYYTDVSRNWYYRIRTEGHNCIVFDQGRGWETGGQTAGENLDDARTPIYTSGKADGAVYTVFDMQPSYQETVKEYKRGFALVNNRTQIVVQDEFETNEPYELHSYYHTTKNIDITLNPDGRSLTMKTKDGKYCKVSFITDIPDLEVGVMDAVHHSASPKPGPDNTPGLDNSIFQKIVLHSGKVTKGKITMIITPMLEDAPVDLPQNLPLSDWDKYLKNNIALTGISIDGIPLAEFEEGIGSYSFETEKLGTVTATAGPDVELAITQAASLGETALIKATNKQSGDSFTYKINFTKLSVPGVSSGVDFASVDAPKIPQKENPPAHMHDGNLSTRFAVNGYDGSANFTADLGSSRFLKGFSVAFYNGHTRKNKFKVEVSDDKTSWTTVFDGFSPGNSDALLKYDFAAIWGRYVRFTGYGCYAGDEKTQVGEWNSVNEFVVHEEVVDFADTKSHWAQSDIQFARNHSLVNGIGDNMYMPENSVTRAEFLTMMVRACGFENVDYKEGTFSDVKNADWYSKIVMTAKDKGIISPEMIQDGCLYPNKQLTREEMCAVAVLAYTAAANRNVVSANITSIFKDLSDGPYLSYIDKAIGLRIVNGMSPDTFAPSANITRAQAATILKRLYLKIFNVNN